MTWAMLVVMGTKDTHVVPVQDTARHTLTLECWCAPERDHEAPELVVHTSHDGREAYERRIRLPN